MDTALPAGKVQNSRASVIQTGHHCKCCGRVGFVFVEEIGEYLCRDAYLKYNKEQLDRAARYSKRKD